jgi:hypothetical protein
LADQRQKVVQLIAFAVQPPPHEHWHQWLPAWQVWVRAANRASSEEDDPRDCGAFDDLTATDDARDCGTFDDLTVTDAGFVGLFTVLSRNSKNSIEQPKKIVAILSMIPPS